MGPAILFVADASPVTGGGHVMRCLTLSRALTARGARCAFVTTRFGAGLVRGFAPDVEVHGADDLVAAARAMTADLAIFDHFGLGADQQRAAANGAAIAALDDMADRPLAAALVIAPGLDCAVEAYAGLLPPGAGVLAGPRYALVRPEFAAARAAAIARRERTRLVRRVLVSLGLTDVGGVTRPVVGRVLTLLPEVEVDVVVGEAAESRAGLAELSARDPRVRLHVAAKDMAALMASADLCVGAGGSTTWERCTLGLPTVLLIVAENQRRSGLVLRDAGATLLADGVPAGLDEPLTRLYRDAGLRRRVGQASAALCDGQGAGRAAEACYALLA